MIELKCRGCGTKVGEISKGKFHKTAVCLCGKCNYNSLLDENKKPDLSDEFKDIFGFK